MNLKILINQYAMRKEAYYRNQFVEVSNRYGFREADEIDHLEMIEAKVRYELICEVCNDLYKITSLFGRKH